MKKFFAALMFAAMGLTAASAQPYGYYHAPARVIVRGGGGLNGVPALIVRNGSVFPIIDLWAVQRGGIFYPNTAVNLLAQTGVLMGRQSTRYPVQFPGCVVDVYVMTTTHIRHEFPNVNVCAGTYWTIPVW